jgi:hypothetical protein
MATNSSERGCFLALPRRWMAVAQVRVSLARDSPARLAALPAVVHKRALRSDSLWAISRKDAKDAGEKSSSLRSGRSLREKSCPQSYSFPESIPGSFAIFPAFSLIVGRKPMAISQLQIPSVKTHRFRQDRAGPKDTGSRRGTVRPAATKGRRPQISPMTRITPKAFGHP